MLDSVRMDPLSSIRSAANSVGFDPAECKNCRGKSGLAILPICAAPMPRAIFDWLKGDAYAQAVLKKLDGYYEATDLSSTWYYLRSLPTGYLYILKENMTWDAYAVGGDGMLNQMPVDSLPDSSDEAQLSACKREGHSNVMPRFLCVDHEKNSKVWMAFSRHRWTSVVRRRYEANTDNCRTTRMREVNITSVANGDIGRGKAVEFGMQVSSETLTAVADFTPAAFQTKFHGFAGHAVLDLESQKDALASAMERVSARTNGKKGVMIMLPDAIGVAEEFNLLRMQAKQRYEEWQAGGPAVDGSGVDRLRAWKRQSATHVAYIESWVSQEGTRAGERTAQSMKQVSQKINETELAPFAEMTEAKFNRLYGDKINQPVEDPKGGLNPWSGAKWVPNGNWTERKKIEWGDGEWQYDPKSKIEPLGNVEHSDAYWDALSKYHAGAITKKKLARYRKRLDVGQLSAFNKLYADQDKAWCEHIMALDNDYVTYVQNRWPAVILEHDFDNATVLNGNSTLKQINEKLSDALARLLSTDMVYGGGAVSQASLDLLAEQFDKDPKDVKNWIASALLRDFKLIDAVTSSSSAPDIYSGIIGATQLPKAWWEQFKQYRVKAVSAAQNLLLPMQQVAHQKRTKLLVGAGGGGVGAIASELSEIGAKEVVWVRAAALWGYLGDMKEHYSIRVTFKAGDYLDAIASGNALAAGAFVLEGRSHGDRSKVRSNRFDARKVLNKLARHKGLQGEITVPLVVDRTALSKAGVKEGTVQLYNIGHAKGVAKIPNSVAASLLQNPTVWHERRWATLISREVGVSGFAMMLSGWQFWQAVEALGATSGFRYADAVASLMSGASGMVGGTLELAAYWTQVTGRQAVPVASSLLSSNVNRSLSLRFGAGVGGGIGALLSAVSSFVNAGRTASSGERQAAHNYVGSGVALTLSGVASIGGAYLTWRAALAARAGQQVAVRLLAGTALRTSMAALIGASATGIGIVLLIVGVIWAIYAASLEHDENEKFLDRSFFGKHEREEDGRFGGNPMADEDAWVAHGMNDEMLALGTLALGISGEISNWEDNLRSRDMIHARIHLGAWDPEVHEIRYRLEAYATKPQHTGGRAPAGSVIARGPHRGERPQPLVDNPHVHELQIRSEINDKKYQAVRLVFALHNIGEEDPIAQAEVWKED